MLGPSGEVLTTPALPAITMLPPVGPEVMMAEPGPAPCAATPGGIGAGKDWLKAVEDALAKSKAVLVLCSKASVHRPWVQFEVWRRFESGTRKLADTLLIGHLYFDF